MEKDSVCEGDGVLLFCEKAKGFIFSPPPLSPDVCSIGIHTVDQITHVRHPGFSNVHFAAFKIQARNTIIDQDKNAPKTSKTLVYGRKVHLFHVASSWYMSFNESKHDSYKLITLVSNREYATVFRIIPSDPTKSTGQPISVEDRVRLEIIDSPGHTSQVLCAPNVFSFNGYDLKKASDGSDFTIYPQSSGEKLGPPMALRGGEVVMFLNEKRDAIITVKKEADYEVVGKVPDQYEGTGRADVDSFWQIENATTQYDGNWVDLKIPWHIRIKHHPTKQYLILTQDEATKEKRLSLATDDISNDSVFYLEEDRSDPDTGLLKRRHVLIKHVKTNTYLTLEGKNGSRVIDRNRCYNISLESQLNEVSEHRDQKFWIQEVDDETIKKFSALSGAFIILREYLEKLNENDENETTGSVIATPTNVLDALANWTGEDKGSGETWPDMLRAMEGVELVLDFLSRPVDPTTTRTQKILCTVLDHFIHYASEESQQYLISQDRLLNSLFPLMGHSVGAEELMSSLIKCPSFSTVKKEEILEKFFEPERILKSVLEEKKNFKFLKCLSALCVSAGKAERKLQIELVDKIIIPGHQQGIFFRIRREGNNSVSVTPPKMLQECTDQQTLNSYLENQIEFYAATCQGVNLYSIEKLTQTHDIPDEEILTYNNANQCVFLYSNSPRIQSAFYSYLVSSLVDKNAEESGTDLNNIWYIYSWARFLKKDTSFKPVTMSAIANTHDIISDKEEMIKVQNVIQDSLETKNWNADIEAGREDLMTQKLRVLETLVAYGFYWTADEEHEVNVPSPGVVIKALIDIIGYSYESDTNKEKRDTISKLQSQAIIVLHLFLQQTYYLATSRVMYDYRYFHEDQSLTEDNQNGFAVPKSSLRQLTESNFEIERQYMFIQHIPQIRRHLIDQKVTEARDRLRWMLYEEEFDTALQNFPGPRIDREYDYKLLNIYDEASADVQNHLIKFWSSDNDILCLVAAQLYFDLFKGEEFAFSRSEKSQIVTDSYPPSWDTYTTMVKYATYQDQVKTEYIRALLRLTQGKGADPKIKPCIMSFANDVINTAGTPPGCSGLFPRDETYTSKTGQNIVLTTGVFGVLMNYVLKYSLCIIDGSQTELIIKICAALLAIVRNNNEAKQIVFDRIDDLLNAQQGFAGVAHLITEVLTDNIDLCRKLSFSTVRKMFRMATVKDSVNEEYHELIPAIEAWVKVSKSAPQLLKTHQRFVTTLFEQYFKDHYETDWNPDQSPITLLEQNNDVFLLLTHMLGICVEGIHKYSEDVARDVFSFSVLAKIVSNDAIPFEKRLPFLIVLNEGFIKTERESLVSVIEFTQNELIWLHIDTVTQLIQKISEKLASIASNKKSVAWHMAKVKVIFFQHMTHLYWKSHKIFKVNLKSALKEEDVTGIDGTKHSIGILYQYIIEGIVPMVASFAEEYKMMVTQYKDRMEHSHPLSDDKIHKLKLFGQEIESLVKDNRTIFVTSEHQRVFWENALKHIVSIDQEYKVRYHFDIEPFAYDIDQSEERLKEQKINDDFQTYLSNFKSLVYHSDDDEDTTSLYPRGPGFKILLNRLFEPNNNGEISEANEMHVKYLVKLLQILYKQIALPHNSCEVDYLNKLVITVLQVLSGVLYRENKTEDDEFKQYKDRSLYKWQKVFIKHNVHQISIDHTDNTNNEIVLQVFNLLKLMALDANVKAQDVIIDRIDDKDSMFCYKVYFFLETVIFTFGETWAKAQKKKSKGFKVAKKEQQPLDVADVADVVDEVIEADDGMKLMPLESPEYRSRGMSIESVPEDGTGTLELQSLDDNIRMAGIVLECISSLSDGQHVATQNFLLDQDQSFKKLDIIKRIAVLLEVLTEEYEKTLKLCEKSVPKRVYSYLDLIQKAIQALIETTAGNFKNQQAVFQCQITDTINYLLANLVDIEIPTEGWSDESRDTIMEKKEEISCKSVELLQVLLEETNDGSLSLIANFAEDVDLDSIIKAMLTWKDIGAYHILRLVANTKGISVDRLVFTKSLKWSADEIELWKDFKARSRCIEVLYQPFKESDSKILTKVYFDFDPLYEIDEVQKETVTNAITEESQEENLTEFNEWGRSLRKNAQFVYQNFLSSNKMIWVYRIIYETSLPRNLLLGFLTIVLNFLVLFSFMVPDDHTYTATNSTPNIILHPTTSFWYFPILVPLGVLHIILSVFMIIEYIVTEIPNFTKNVFFVTFADNIWKSFKKWFTQQEMLKPICPVDWRLRQKQRAIPPHILLAALNPTDEEDAVVFDEDEIDELYYYEDDDDEGYFNVDIFGFQSLYRFLFLLCSIVAIPFDGYPYCICLFYVFLNIDVVQYILVALSRSCKQLLFVALIGGAIILVFAMIGFLFLHDFFESSTPLYCDTLWQCFISTTREGLLDTLGPAIPLSVTNGKDPSYTHYALRTIFFDIPFFVIVTTIVLNIVTAVLIDRFSDLREERDAVESKKMKACFICGLESEKFERFGKGFRDHVKEDHNKWNYIYYLMYLDRKPRNDLTALEKQIADDNKIDKRYGKTDHYPIKRSKILPKDQQGEAAAKN